MKKNGCPKGYVQLGKHCIPGWCKTHYIDHYGSGNTLVDRGFLLPDGSVMDFSKLYHTEIAKPRWKKGSTIGFYSNFMKACKAIRYSVTPMGEDKKKILVLESYNKPTGEQASQFVKLISRSDKMYGERSGNKMWPCSYEVSNPTPLDAQKFISRCW